MSVAQGQVISSGVRRGWRDIVLLLPKIALTALLAIAIADMIAGVFLRYVMVEITDWLNMDPINFFWVEETGEFALAWLTLVGAAIGIAERSHFTLRVLTHRLPLAAQRAIHVVNHLIIAGFGALTAYYGTLLAISNLGLTSPGLDISLAWVYASAGVGGILIVLYGLGTAMTEPPDASEPLIDDRAAIAAGGD